MEGNLKSEVNHFYENIDVFRMPAVLIYSKMSTNWALLIDILTLALC